MLFSVIQSINKPILILTKDNLIIKAVNDSFFNLFALDKKDLQDEPFKKAFPEVDPSSFEKIPNQIKLNDKNGKSVNLNLIDWNFYEESLILVYYNAINPVTVDEKIEIDVDSIFNSSFVENITYSISIKDTKTWNYKFVNKSWERVFNAKSNKVINNTDFDIFNFKFAMTSRQYDIYALKIKNKHNIQSQYEDELNKKTIYLNQIRIPIFDKNQEVNYLVTLTEDITTKVKTEQRLKKLEYEFNLVSKAAQQTTSAIIIMDIDGKVIWVNKSFTKLTEYTFEEAIGKDPRELLQGPETGKQISELIRNKIQLDQSFDIRTYYFTKSKKGFWADLIVDPLFDQDGKHIGFISVENDITEKVEFEIALRTAKQQAEESNKLKSNFLASMSHEIRTPMIGILGWADLLREELQDPDYREMAERIFVNGERLMETINSIIDLSRIETNKLEMDLRGLSLNSLAQDVYFLYENVAKKKNLEFTFNSLEKDIFANLDDKMARSIINNIVNNAIKFTSKGFIKIETVIITNDFKWYKDLIKANNTEWGGIQIQDSGIGIPEDKIKIVFDEFRQVSEGHDRKYEGSGLGLTISKKFTELMNGKIFVESEFGVGTKFTLAFPLIKIET